jgi:hypothetical protein
MYISATYIFAAVARGGMTSVQINKLWDCGMLLACMHHRQIDGAKKKRSSHVDGCENLYCMLCAEETETRKESSHSLVFFLSPLYANLQQASS